MAAKCVNCGKSAGYGHAVSHSKVRLNRKFMPNLQKLRVLQNGRSIRVKLCGSCIKRLKKDNHLGSFTRIKYYQKEESVKQPKKPTVVKKPVEETEKINRQASEKAMNLEDIIGKK